MPTTGYTGTQTLSENLLSSYRIRGPHTFTDDFCLSTVLEQSFLLSEGLQTSRMESSKRLEDHSVAVSDDQIQSSLSRITVTLEIVSSTMDEWEPTE